MDWLMLKQALVGLGVLWYVLAHLGHMWSHRHLIQYHEEEEHERPVERGSGRNG